jgi:hypothetical protein
MGTASWFTAKCLHRTGEHGAVRIGQGHTWGEGVRQNRTGGYRGTGPSESDWGIQGTGPSESDRGTGPSESDWGTPGGRGSVRIGQRINNGKFQHKKVQYI